MKNHEASHYTPDSIKDQMISGFGNDQSRWDNFRHVDKRLEDNDRSRPVTEVPMHEGEWGDLTEAEKAPNETVELANLQNRRDAEELARIEEREAEIGNPNIFKTGARRELGQLAARRLAIDPEGTIAKEQEQFVENNLDLLVENAKAHAARDGVEVNEGDKAA